MHKNQNIDPSHSVIALLGGTFDPIHQGHTAIATHLLKSYPIHQVDMLPNASPPHKSSHASAQQRLDMLTLATSHHTHISINTNEIYRSETCYTLDTLKALKSDQPHTTFCFVIGMDNFNQIETWKGHEELLRYCHLIIIHRQGVTPLPSPWGEKTLAQCHTENPHDILKTPAGNILIDHYTPPWVSSSELRQELQRNTTAPIQGIHDDVLAYIRRHQLYQD